MPLFWTSPKKQKIKKAIFLHKLSIRSKRRVSLLISTPVRGSMTVEACLVIPIFLFFMMSVLYAFQIIHLQTQVLAALHQEGNKISLEAYRDRERFKDEYVILEENYQIKPFLFWLDFGNLEFAHQYYGHAWVGYDISRHKESGVLAEYVYIAETGTVYHRSGDCTYLELSVRSAGRGELSSLRNKAGGNYYQCEICNGYGGSICYITDYGSRYHSNPVCSGLKRTVFRILLKEAATQGKHACSKCG